LLTLEKPKNLRLADVTFNKTEFDPTIDYGKKPALLVLRKRPQDIVVGLFFHYFNPALRAAE
jgi:hypothetical protein